ncbi:MAG: hypothetical protein ACREYC_00215 [Gammaproteobacteria bacterium]
MRSVQHRAWQIPHACGVAHTAEFGVRNVSFLGLIGEPLVVRAAFVPAIAYLLEHGMRVGLFTNGVLMDGPVIDAVIAKRAGADVVMRVAGSVPTDVTPTPSGTPSSRSPPASATSWSTSPTPR